MSYLSSTTTKNQTMASEADVRNDISVGPQGPEDTVLDLLWLLKGDYLAVALWDKKVRVYQVTDNGQTQGQAMYEHEGPVLLARWLMDGTKIVSGGGDKAVRLFDVQLQLLQQIGQHDAPVRSVRHVECGPTKTQAYVLGLWDKTLRYWDTRLPTPMATVQLPERVYSMDALQQLLVAGLAERHVVVVNLQNPQTIFRQLILLLKYQTRVVKCFASGDGYGLGLVEGRCSIVYLDENTQRSKGFLFKCHRNARNTNQRSPETDVYAVNAMDMHPAFPNTFATAGLDGAFSFWDKDQKQRLRGFPTLQLPITAAAFNSSGTIFAYALGYDWSKGHQMNNQSVQTSVKLHPVKEAEVQPRMSVKK